MIPAVVLAAGASVRMGTPKALLLDPDGRPFVARVIRTLQTAGLADIVVVAGTAFGEVVAAVAADGLSAGTRVIRNPDPGRGQLSSLLAGMDVMRPDTGAVMVTLVDVPMVRVATARAVADAWRARGAAIVRPAIGDRHGHPVVFDRRVFEALRAAPMSEGAKRVVRDFGNEIENVPVDDEGCLTDVDTPEDYANLTSPRART